jgi:hypothetical protein
MKACVSVGGGSKQRGWRRANIADVLCIMYESKTIKFAEIVLWKVKGCQRVNLIKIYCKHIHKCHNVSPLYKWDRQIKNEDN